MELEKSNLFAYLRKKFSTMEMLVLLNHFIKSQVRIIIKIFLLLLLGRYICM